MKNIALCVLSLLMLAGCSKMPFSLPFTNDGGKTTPAVEAGRQPERKATYGVSPEAQAYLAEAMEYWTASGECTNPERAAELLDKAVAADPLDPAPYLMRSLALSDLGYFNEAFDDATRAIRISPTAEAYATRGLICLKQHQPEGARRDSHLRISLCRRLPGGSHLRCLQRSEARLRTRPLPPVEHGCGKRPLPLTEKTP